MKNLTKRGKIWYVAARVNGKRISQSLDTTDKAEAAKRARRILVLAKASKWDEVDGLKAASDPVATVGQLLAEYRRIAADRYDAKGSPSSKTRHAYVNQLRNVIRQGSGATEDKIDGLPLSVLSGDLVRRYVQRTMAGTDGNILAEDRARRTITSTLRSARAVFASWTRELYEGKLTLPAELEQFLKVDVGRSGRKKYALPPRDLIDRTIAAGRALMDTDTDLCCAFLLCYDLGLRAGEASHVKWDWFTTQTNGDGEPCWYLEIKRRADWKPKSGERRVPVARSVWAMLQACRRNGDEYLLPHRNNDMIERRLSAWMRSLGWDRQIWPKAAHELRKLIGSEWYTRFGVEVACSWLGHADIRTTFQFYSDLTRHPAPIEIDDLKAN